MQPRAGLCLTSTPGAQGLREPKTKEESWEDDKEIPHQDLRLNAHPFLLSIGTAKCLPPPLPKIQQQTVHRPEFLSLGAPGGKFDGSHSPERGESRNSHFFLFHTKGDPGNGKRSCCWWSCPAALQPRAEALGTSGVVPPAGWALSWVSQGLLVWDSKVKRNHPHSSEVWQQLWNRASSNNRSKGC